jgi:Zn finger protein HypA/HybF involved in hydrogenase expression
MKIDIKRFQLRCKRCDHRWSPTQIEIRICPRCKSPYWDVKRKKKKEEKNVS